MRQWRCHYCLDGFAPAGMHDILGTTYRLCPVPGRCSSCTGAGLFPVDFLTRRTWPSTSTPATWPESTATSATASSTGAAHRAGGVIPMFKMAKGRGWAYLGTLLGGLVSIAANVAHSYITPDPDLGAVVSAIVWPVFLFIAIEILGRTAWPEAGAGTYLSGLAFLRWRSSPPSPPTGTCPGSSTTTARNS